MFEAAHNEKNQLAGSHTATAGSKESWLKGCSYNDRLETIWWGVMFLWAGFVVLMTASEYAVMITWWDGWSVFFTGAGLITLLGTLYRQVSPVYARPETITYLFGVFLLMIGVDGLADLELFWPVMLILVGGSVLRSAVRHQR